MLHFALKRFDDLTLRELYDVLWLRDAVFVVGQKITAECEVDGSDPQCSHVLGRDEGGRIVATARLFLGETPIKVGRIGVHPDLQRQGLGTALMQFIAEVLGDRPAIMSAQAHLTAWYTSLGWQPLGSVYSEAGIPHQRMTRGPAAAA